MEDAKTVSGTRLQSMCSKSGAIVLVNALIQIQCYVVRLKIQCVSIRESESSVSEDGGEVKGEKRK